MEILSTGEKIKKHRKKLGMTLKDLAGNRITTGQISLIESGKSNPSMDLLQYLADSLNISVEYLIESEYNQAIKICNYYEDMAFCFVYQNDLERANEYLSNIENILNDYDIEEFRYKISFINGIINYKLGNYSIATYNFLSSNVGFLKYSMYKELVDSYLYLSYICIGNEDNIGSIIHLECAIKIIESHIVNRDVSLFKAYYLISDCYFKVGDGYQGNYYLNKAMSILDNVYNPRGKIDIFLNQSEDYMELNDIDNAIKFSKLSREYFEDINRMENVNLVQVGISNRLIEKNKLVDAKIYLNRAKNIVEDYNFDNLLEIYGVFISLYIKENSIDKAKYYLCKYEKILDMGNIEGVLRFFILKYKVHMLEESYADAEILLILAYNFFKDNKFHKQSGDFCLYLSKLYFDMGRYVESSNSMDEVLVQYEKANL